MIGSATLFNGLHYIGGEWISDAPNGYSDSINPYNCTCIGEFPNGSVELVDQAINAAHSAFDIGHWQYEPRLRAAVLLEFADRLEDQSELIVKHLTDETGKLLVQAKHEVSVAISEARYYAGLARNIFGRTFESGEYKLSLLTREPAGIVAVIVPWNAPIALLVRSVAPALAAGCSVIIKPALQSSLTNNLVINCFDQVKQLPKGVINSINEFGVEIGKAITSHPLVDVISFTGSSHTGSAVMRTAALTTKHVTLELGGKAPAIIFSDADIDEAIREIKNASIALNGQMCTSVSRVLVQSSKYEEVKNKLSFALVNVQIGNPSSSKTDLGPLIDRESQSRILSIIDRACKEVDIILCGRESKGRLAAGCLSLRHFSKLTILKVGWYRKSISDRLFHSKSLKPKMTQLSLPIQPTMAWHPQSLHRTIDEQCE